MGHRDLLVTHNLSDGANQGYRPHPRGSVRRASGFLLTGNSPHSSHCVTVLTARRRKEKAGCEASKLWHQRRRVEGAGTRSGSLSGGAASSQERPSTKRRRSTSLRATRL